MALTAEQIEILKKDPEIEPLDLSWLNPNTQRGITAKPGRRGLTLDEINVGLYGEAPDVTTNRNHRPRGAAVRHEAPRIGLVYTEKVDVWSSNAALLYEEAVQRQWSSATAIPWETLEPLPDDLELAMCQLCTFLTEVEFIAGDSPGQWMPRISNDYYETKLFLATQLIDEARHLDVFRKRALVNGGGLLKQSPGSNLRDILGSLDFTEMSVLMHILAEGFVQSMFRTGELIGQNEAEKRIFRLCAQDESRHLAFGVMHLKYILDTQPERREELHSYLDRAEAVLNDPRAADASLSEALGLLLGGGRKNFDEGMRKFLAVRKKQVNEYMHRLEVAGMPERRERMHPAFRMFLEPARN